MHLNESLAGSWHNGFEDTSGSQIYSTHQLQPERYLLDMLMWECLIPLSMSETKHFLIGMEMLRIAK